MILQCKQGRELAWKDMQYEISNLSCTLILQCKQGRELAWEDMQYKISNLSCITKLQCKQRARVRMGIYLTPWHISATKGHWHRISLYPTLCMTQ